MKIRLTTLFVFLLISLQAFGQSTYVIMGVVRDVETREVMPFTTVFLAGSTFGTTTNEKGQFTLEVDRNGTYDLIAKFVGYETYSTKLILSEKEVSTFDIYMTPGVRDLGSVVVVARKERQWKRFLNDFKIYFLGRSVNATSSEILNEEDLDFIYDEETSQLIAFSDEPVIVLNKALGYKIKCFLEDFVLDYSTGSHSYYTYTVFEELKPKNERKARMIERNRKAAYNGSAIHFFKSLYSKRLKEEGFFVELTKEPNNVAAFSLLESMKIHQVLKVRDATDHKSLSFKDYLSIWFMKEKEPWRFRQNIKSKAFDGASFAGKVKSYQQSWIILLENHKSIDFEANGLVKNPEAFYSLGYWAFEKVADMVPTDYNPSLKN